MNKWVHILKKFWIWIRLFRPDPDPQLWFQFPGRKQQRVHRLHVHQLPLRHTQGALPRRHGQVHSYLVLKGEIIQ